MAAEMPVAAEPMQAAAMPAAEQLTPIPTPSRGMPVAATQKMEQTMDKAMKTAEEFVSFSQANVEAFVKSSQIWAAGLQDLSKQFAATAQSSMDETVSTLKALSSVKSLKEAMELQASLARANVEKTVSVSSQFADASFKLAEQAMAPITARIQLATAKLTPAA